MPPYLFLPPSSNASISVFQFRRVRVLVNLQPHGICQIYVTWRSGIEILGTATVVGRVVAYHHHGITTLDKLFTWSSSSSFSY